MEKLVRISYKNKKGEQKKWNYHFHSDCTTATFGDVKRAFALMNGFYEDRIRLIYGTDILDESKLLSETENGWENCSYPPSSDSDSEKDALETGAHQDQDNREAEHEEKGTIEESEKEQSKHYMKLFNEFYSTLSLQPNYTSSKEKLNKSKKLELQDQIITVMRMQREEREPFQSIERPGPVLVLDVEVEETFTIAIITANDDVKYLSCRGQDTLGITKLRCANLFQCSRPQELELRRREDSNIFTEGELQMSLDELPIADGDSLFASRKGRHEIRTLFGLCACMDIDVNMEKNARSLRRKIVTIAPDLTYVNFFMWYSGKFLSIEKDAPALGDVIMGSSLLRVVIEMDPQKPFNEDTGPELRRVSGEEEARRRRENRPPRLSSSSEKSDDSQERSAKPQERLWFDVNKRALRNFDLVVECYNGTDNGVEDEPPISLTKLTYRMLFYELRKKIAAVCGEKSSHQILYRKGEPFKPEHDRKTLGELELIPDDEGIVKTIYKEPSITVFVEYKNEKIPMKVAGRGTSFGHLAELVVYEKKVPLTIDKIAFEYKDFLVTKDIVFSDVEVRNNDTIKIVETFNVRVWQWLFIYDKEFWPHSQVSDFKEWIERESGIKADEQMFVKIEDNSTVKIGGDLPSKFTMQDYGMAEMGEIEVFDVTDLPDWLKEKEKGSKVADAVSTDDEDGCCENSDDDEDDRDYNPN